MTVFVKERPNIGTATDINGNYLIDVSPDDVLEFSYVGYKTQDVAVAGRGQLDVVLEQNDAILDAVEVVGYGVQKKISVIGSQQSIEVEELKVPVANLSQGLAGRVAGLVSVQRTSEPGFDDADIYIRGISTLTASMSAPLTLVDGVPRSFSNVDPEDIESFSILKDASATAVYGVRGANGVIIINTARGKIINDTDLANALSSGRVGYAAIDVLAEEPPVHGSPLIEQPHCMVTPHIAWAPLQARRRCMQIVEDNIRAFQQGKPQNVVNP